MKKYGAQMSSERLQSQIVMMFNGQQCKIQEITFVLKIKNISKLQFICNTYGHFKRVFA